MKTRTRIALVLALVPALALAIAFSPHQQASADGNSSAWLNFASYWGSASTLRTVSYGGFGDNEALDFTFFDSNGNQVMVGQGTTYYASTESDGSGVFPFRPSDWFSNIDGGQWTVQVVGETSGISLSTTFHIYD